MQDKKQSVLALIEIVSAFEGKPYARHVRAAVWAVMGLTVLISSALLFNNEADNIRVLAPDTYRFFEKLFR